MAPVSEPERRDLWEICEERYHVRSAILTSQTDARGLLRQKTIPYRGRGQCDS